MAYLELRQFIRATPERVWEIIADIPGQEAWMIDLRNVKITSEVKEGVGTVLEMRTTVMAGLPLLKDVMRVTKWEPPHEFAIDHIGQFSGKGAFVLEPALDGTVFIWWEYFEPPLGKLGELGYRLLVDGHLRRVFTHSLENLRRLAESTA